MLTLGVNNRPKLSQETFKLLRDAIYKKCGVAFADNKRYLLETRLHKRLEKRNLKNFEDYYYYLTYDTNKDAEFHILINCIVTNETSFFRDPVQLDVFKKGVIPKVMAGKEKSGDKTLKIWSAASSTGEEPYTLAMMLMEHGLHLKGWKIEIIGSDISDNVLKNAEAGRYDKYALRNTPEVCVKKYFTNTGDTYTVNPQVRSMVRYKKINLVNSFETRMVKGIDIVFCRNVLIYFDDASKKKAVGHLYDSMVKGGYLFVGFSETLHSITRLLRPVSIERSVVYQKM